MSPEAGERYSAEFLKLCALNIMIAIKPPSSLDEVRLLLDPKVREFFYTELDAYLVHMAKKAVEAGVPDVWCECVVDGVLMRYVPPEESSFANRQAIRASNALIAALKAPPA